MVFLWIAVGALFVASVGLALKVRQLNKQLRALPTRIEHPLMEPVSELHPEEHAQELERTRARYRGWAS